MDKFEELYGKHVEDSSLKEQLEYVDWELRNSHKKAGRLLKEAKTLEEGVHIIDKYYERSAGLHGEKRVKHATNALNNWNALSGKVKEANTSKDAITQLIEWLISLFKKEN